MGSGVWGETLHLLVKDAGFRVHRSGLRLWAVVVRVEGLGIGEYVFSKLEIVIIGWHRLSSGRFAT